MRTDTHRPSVINPAEYMFVGILYDPQAAEVVGGNQLLAEESHKIHQFMEEHGARWATHQHGGSCMCCGASALYLGVFYHEPHNECITVGQDCAVKLAMGHESDFRHARERVRSAIAEAERKATIARWIESNGLTQAEELYKGRSLMSSGSRDVDTIIDIMGKFHRYGSMSDKQLNFVRALLQRINGDAPPEEPKGICPSGRINITGTIISIKDVKSRWGTKQKMLVKTPENYKVWGSVPRGLEAVKGAQVSFVATVTTSEQDASFGIFSRPLMC